MNRRELLIAAGLSPAALAIGSGVTEVVANGDRSIFCFQFIAFLACLACEVSPQAQVERPPSQPTPGFHKAFLEHNFASTLQVPILFPVH